MKSFTVDYAIESDEGVGDFVELVDSLLAIKEAYLHHNKFLL